MLGTGQRSWLPPRAPDLGPWLVATQGSGQAAGGSWALVPVQLLALLVAWMSPPPTIPPQAQETNLFKVSGPGQARPPSLGLCSRNS